MLIQLKSFVIQMQWVQLQRIFHQKLHGITTFLKNRFNKSLESIGIDSVFEIDEKLVSETEWFDDEIIGTKHGDFFVKRSINYSKRTQSITSDDLF